MPAERWDEPRLYVFNSRYPFLAEQQALLAKALTFYPESTHTGLTMNRRRLRRRGKPDEASLTNDAA